ncbi:hypothetical protein CR513_61924, partial [Mucuna pruriens]
MTDTRAPILRNKFKGCTETNLFEWQSSYMLIIDPNFLCHRLALYAEVRSLSQKKRKIRGDRKVAMEHEKTKLKKVGFIREVNYTTWLFNMVFVKKNNEKWRMYVNYTDLNKACPKESYPLLSID